MLCSQVWRQLIYPFLIYNDFTADTLRHAMILTSDRLTLNVCSVSAVTWSNFVPNFSEIEQSAAELNITNLGPSAMLDFTRSAF